ncbi:hypothetical+protein [Methylocapsa aurea]
MNLLLVEISKAVAPGAHAALVVDRAGWHMTDKLVVPSNITLVPLPAKCPELNPAENVWQFPRENWLSNRVFKSYDDIVDHCCAAWNKLIEQPWRIMVHRATRLGAWVLINEDWYYVKVRQNGRIVSVAVIIAIGVNNDGRREVLGMDIGPSEAETFWIDFPRKLRRRGLRGVKLVVSDAHEGIKAAVAKVMHAGWQRCRVHFMCNALAHASKSGRRVVSAFIATAFAQDDADAAKMQWRKVADQLRPTLPKLAVLMDEAEQDVLAYMTFPKDHWQKIYSTNGLERVNGEIKRRTEVVGIFPNEDAITRLVGAILLETNDEWAVQRGRYMTLETIASLSDDPIVRLSAVTA